jgi:cytoskeleton protein RodZ
MKRTGEILKKGREQKGLSINEIALSLKISSKILKSIEEGDANQLPAKTFLRGFVQSYASYLRLDVNEVLRVFQEEMGTTKPSPIIQMPEQDATLELFEKKSTEGAAPRPTAPAQEKSFNSLAKTNNNSKTLTLTVLGLVLVGLIVFTKKMIDKYQKEGTVSEVDVTTPLATSPSETSSDAAPAAETNSEAAAGRPPSSPLPAATAMSTPLATPTPTYTPTPAPTVTPNPTLTPKATATPSSSITPTATPNPSPSESPSPSATPANKPVEVIIEALDNVEIEYITKDSKTEKISLRAEQVHTFKSKNGLRLNISNGGAINIIVNGKDLGIPGNLGKPVKLNF